MSHPDPSTLSPVLHHLLVYGECYAPELDRDAQRWPLLLANAGWVMERSQGVYAATQASLALADLSESQRLRRVCFAVPAYRGYLTAILAQGLVQAGQLEGYDDKVEGWVLGSLGPLAQEINALLDELESGQGRMIEWPAAKVSERFADWHAGHGSFVEWDRALLGISGTPAQLFSAVLGHADAVVDLHVVDIPDDKPIALLPDFELTRDDVDHLALPGLEPWATARQSVYSSLPFFDANGKPLYDPAQSEGVVWQDVLAQQPYYRAVLRTAIAVRMSGYDQELITLFVHDELDHTQVLIGNRVRGTLAKLLPDLVTVMGYHAQSKLSPRQAGRVLEHWIAVGALERRDSQIVLRESYARTLHERRRARMLLRGTVRDEQERLERFLKESH